MSKINSDMGDLKKKETFYSIMDMLCTCSYFR